MKYDTFFSGTCNVAAQLDCDNIKVWREWLSFHGHKNIFVFLTQTIRADWEPALFFVPVGKLSTSGCATQRERVY